jgi:hypothetical protein
VDLRFLQLKKRSQPIDTVDFSSARALSGKMDEIALDITWGSEATKVVVICQATEPALPAATQLSRQNLPGFPVPH